jgi:transportin-3
MKVWPTLSVCLNKYPDDFKIVESCCRSLRFVLRCCDKHSQAILADVVNTVSLKKVVETLKKYSKIKFLKYQQKKRKIVTLYRRKHFSCFLYLGSILVDIYGTEEGFKSGLIEMMQVSKQEEKMQQS